MQIVFIFKADWFVDGRSQPLVAKAAKAWVEHFIPEKEFERLFGGYATWHEPATRSPEMPGIAIGVWGRRNVSHFRRLLQERGALPEMRHEEGPQQQLASQLTIK